MAMVQLSFDLKLKEKVKTQPETRYKTVEEYVDVEHISLHGCTRNTFSEAEDTTEHNL